MTTKEQLKQLPPLPKEGKSKLKHVIPKYLVYGPSGDILHA